MKIFTMKEITNLSSLSRSTILRMVSRGTFPQRVQLSPRRYGWKVIDIEIWLDQELKDCENHTLHPRLTKNTLRLVEKDLPRL